MGHLGRCVLCWLDSILVEVFRDCLNLGCWKGYYLINALLSQIAISKVLTLLLLHLKTIWWDWNELLNFWRCFLWLLSRKEGLWDRSKSFCCRKGQKSIIVFKGARKSITSRFKSEDFKKLAFLSVSAEEKMCCYRTVNSPGGAL